MWKPFRSVLTALLIVSQVGCASYRTAILPSETATEELNAGHQQIEGEIPIIRSSDGEPVVGVGSEVRITLHNGETVEGEVLRLSDAEIVLGKPGNYGVAENVVAVSDIVEIEARYASEGSSIAAGSVGVFVVLFLGFVALASGSGGLGAN